ncbi:SLATT domain-containing protein [Shewanella algae]|uniref:SLATT domain-containing protein n=1 Tax=Shewanella algae TaxID=38313 RepID=UPI001AADFD00|nr:SLATT domain-containing protein [Shewanella algae]MBO2659762.1 SLATT domain-containing protein [Shewanella algae]MCE9779114.1 SLATT domain-containing protein [Shewanella algae]MCE9828551.1 SLATT domain-containing protein [Shewanella algae]
MAFSDNVWWTRKARIQAEKRLLANSFQSQLLLLWYSFFGVAVSIYYLQIDNSAEQANISGVSWVVYSVLVLCMSGFISGLSFKERAGLIKESYEALQVIYQRLKSNSPDIDVITKDYEQVMGLCENHNDHDYYLALCLEYVTNRKPIDKETGLKPDLDRGPTWYHWFSLTWWTFKRYLMLASLYILPIALLYGLEALM